MIINKITSGFVIQRFDTITNTCLEQTFVAGDGEDYENENGEFILSSEFDVTTLPIQPFHMLQPHQEELVFG